MPKDIFQRGPTWYVNIWDPAKKCKFKKAVGPNRRKAEKVAAQLRGRMLTSELGLRPKNKVPMLDEFIPRFLEARYKGKPSRGYAERALMNFRAFAGNLRLSDITKGLLERYRTKRLNDPIASPYKGRSAGAAPPAGWAPRNGRTVKKTTVNRETTFVLCLMNRAVEWGELDMNPLAGFKKFSEKEFRRKQYLKIPQMNLLVRVADGSLNGRFQDIVLLALYLGRRKGELLRLKRCDCDLDNGYLFLGKTKKGEEEQVPLPPSALEVLTRLCREADAQCREWLFPNVQGTGPIKDVDTAWRVACRKAELGGLHFHDLRHTAISYMVMAGVDYFTIAALVGHTSPTMIEERYGHLSPEHKRASAQIFGVHLDRLLGRGPEGVPLPPPARTVVEQAARRIEGF